MYRNNININNAKVDKKSMYIMRLWILNSMLTQIIKYKHLNIIFYVYYALNAINTQNRPILKCSFAIDY